jgi:hypothetical protein
MRSLILRGALTTLALGLALQTTGAASNGAPSSPIVDDNVTRDARIPGHRDVVIPAGTVLRLRLETSHASNTSHVEDRVQAHLIAPVVVDGRTVLPVNTDALGHVTSARPSGKVKGRGYLAMRSTELRPDTTDERLRVTTRPWARQAPGTKKKDALKIGVPAGVGAVVGGVVGGKKGAAIGAGVGAGAGTGVVLSTAGQNVHLPRGSTVIVRLSAPLTVRLAA